MQGFARGEFRNASRNRRAAFLAALLAVVTLLAGCDMGAAMRAARDKAKEQRREASQEAVTAAFAAVTDEESQRLARTLDDAIDAGDTSGLIGLFDTESFLALILQQPGYESVDPEQFRRGFEKGGVSGDDILRRLVSDTSKIVTPDGDYHRLRIHERDGRKTALFRLIGNDARLNYHEFAFSRGVDGRARIADVYIYATGEWLSQSVGRLMIAAMGPMEGRMSKAESEAADRELANFTKARLLVEKGDYEGLDALVATMSPEMQREKFILVMQISAAGPDQERLIRHSDRLAELYPNDPATFLMCSDRYHVEERYAEALAMMDKLAAHVGGDPYLSAYRAELLCSLDRLPEARAAAEAAYQADPSKDLGLDAVYAALANVAVLEGEFDEAASWVRELADVRQIPMSYACDYIRRDDPAWQEFQTTDVWKKLARE